MSERDLRVGLLVNPIAGMGGSVGLKGTDGEMAERARDLGARPVTPDRTRDFLKHVATGGPLRWLAGPDAMGERWLREAGYDCEIVGEISGRTGPEDTRRIAGEMRRLGVDVLVFVGGDGTARDIFDAVGTDLPVVGVPAGVKVYSAVFAVSARAAARLLDAFAHGAPTGEEEVLDIDEVAFRDGRLDARLYGAMRVPEVEGDLQGGKEASDSGISGRAAKQEVGEYVAGQFEPGVLYLLGPGTTVKAIADAIGTDKTLLGVDAILDRELIGRDLGEADLLTLLNEHERACIVVTPLGGNGFVFGRGNRQFTPAVLRRVGTGSIIIVAIASKLRGIGCLRVDTGDEALDEAFAGYVEVVIGWRRTRMMRIQA
jgi:predicted polyphosphate/ATP-dependent NAD kinase